LKIHEEVSKKKKTTFISKREATFVRKSRRAKNYLMESSGHLILGTSRQLGEAVYGLRGERVQGPFLKKQSNDSLGSPVKREREKLDG